jgi:hypothetical protein
VVELGRKEHVQISCACVFLPLHTKSFGKHAINLQTGQCYCFSMYGEYFPAIFLYWCCFTPSDLGCARRTEGVGLCLGE